MCNVTDAKGASATGFGIARAASLGLVTTDLSCKFWTLQCSTSQPN